MEAATLCFLAFFSIHHLFVNAEAAVKYFIVQGLASSLLLLCILQSWTSCETITAKLFILISIMVKLGIAPFHLWVLNLCEKID